MKSIAQLSGSESTFSVAQPGLYRFSSLQLPCPSTPGQVFLAHFHVKHRDGRCEGLTRRGTRCKARAAVILVRFTSGKQEGQHSACKIHQNTWRWW